MANPELQATLDRITNGAKAVETIPAPVCCPELKPQHQDSFAQVLTSLDQLKNPQIGTKYCTGDFKDLVKALNELTINGYTITLPSTTIIESSQGQTVSDEDLVEVNGDCQVVPCSQWQPVPGNKNCFQAANPTNGEICRRFSNHLFNGFNGSL